MHQSSRCLNCITPPHILKKLLDSRDRDVREAALNTLLANATLRGAREARATAGVLMAPASGQRTIYDCRNSFDITTAIIVRTEDQDAVADETVNRAFDGLGTTREFYRAIFERDSIDGRGLRLEGFVHVGTNWNNASWDGQVMRFGDGDGVIFSDFTLSLDVIAHELAHGVTQYTADLMYWKQPGALNESMSDVFGSLVKQWSLNQTAEDADWLIGAEIFTPTIGADSLRSMKDPGQAYDNDMLGKDPQPDHMDRYYPGPDDNYGVHINSGIPNKAFYLAATGIGGYAWEAAGHIWYESLLASYQTTQFQEFADTTYQKAGELYGANSDEQQVVATAWREVGIRISGLAGASRTGPRRTNPGGASRRGADTSNTGDTLAALTKQIETLSAQIKTLGRDVKALKEKPKS